MKASQILTPERFIALFSLFAVSVSSLLSIIIFLPEKDGIIHRILYYFGIIGCFVVLLILTICYLSQTLSWMNNNKNTIITIISILLALMYSIFDGLKDTSWLVFGRDMCIAFLSIVLWYKSDNVKEYMNKWKKKKDV